MGGAGAGPKVGCKVGQGTELVQAGGLLEVRMTDGQGVLRVGGRLTFWEGAKLIYPEQLMMTASGLLCQTYQRHSCLTVHIIST